MTAVEPCRVTSEQPPVTIQAPSPDGGEAKSVYIHRLFTAIAPRYDWFNRVVSLSLDQRWRAHAIAESGLRPGMDVLDVCTGTGDLALLCAGRAQGQGLVTGVDFNETMLRAASRKQHARRQLVHWLRGDAQALPFRSSSFDRVLIGFSTRNLSDLAQGLREMVRVLKPAGQLVIVETGWPSNGFIRAGYLCFLFTVAPLAGWLLTGRVWPFTYLARSVKGFLRPEQVVSLLKDCGTMARHLPLSMGLASLYLATKSDTEGNPSQDVTGSTADDTDDARREQAVKSFL